MNQEIKQKAYELLINKIDVNTFEGVIYGLVDDKIIDSKSLLFDLISINYKSESFKENLKKLVLNSYSEEELLSLKIYENCLEFLKKNGEQETFYFLQFFASLYVDNSYELDIIYQFYFLNTRYDAIENGYSLMKKDIIIRKTQEHCEKVLNWFEINREKEDWDTFLYEFIKDNVLEEETKVYARNNQIEFYEKEPVSLFTATLNIIKGILGIR
ncbi:hypothetical protein [Tenacibaculum amylolyticum]|uniref:hypothetical protein n=1 Tax=Tenacibaculum amylolyticum TaxID=104269 RepID=UPI003892FEB6